MTIVKRQCKSFDDANKLDEILKTIDEALEILLRRRDDISISVSVVVTYKLYVVTKLLETNYNEIKTEEIVNKH